MWWPIVALVICVTVNPIQMKPGVTIGRLNFECFIKESFQCVNGNCVLKEKHCDGIEDCADGSDEVECDKYHCTPPNWYRCKEGTCISEVYKCDGEDDCFDGSDETDCEGYDEIPRINITCTSDEWQCKNNDCIPIEFVCNGQQDCRDGSDEIYACTLPFQCPGFVCKNGKCIDNSWVCDGAQDCSDNSDEQNCDDRPVNFMCVLENNHYPCHDNSSCIPLRKVCDNITHCKDGSDEGEACYANINKCPITKCGHENSTCVITPAGAKCICPKGYQNIMHSVSDIYSIYNNQQRCVDVDECATIYGLCSHSCVNTPGSYKCDCDHHYNLQPDGTSCKTVNSDPLLLFSTETEIRSLQLISKVLKRVVDNAQLVVGVGHDDHYIYWTELHGEVEALMRAKEDGEHEILVLSGILTPEDLEVDWYTNNIYFTDAELSHIAVCTNDGNHCTILINADIQKPRGIALYPAKGLLYWSDWGKKPQIGSSFMDGSNPKPLVAENLRWPNGIALDVSNDRLYWVDAKLNTVESIKLDGSDRRVVLYGSSKHPFSIAVFEDNIYWSDWKSMSIQTCHKFTCKNRTTVVKVKKHLIYGLRIRHSALQAKFKNPCENSKCSHICLLKGIDNHSCACPEGFELSSNKYKCKVTNKKSELVIGAGRLLITLTHQILGKQSTAAVTLDLIISEMAYDNKNGRIFIADNVQQKIFAFDPIDLTNRNLSVVVPVIDTVEAMDFDPFGNNLYWVDSKYKSIEVFNLAVNQHALLLHDLKDETPIGLALVAPEAVMFIVFRSSNHTYIDRMRMDGKGERTTVISRGLSITGKIRLAFDALSHRIFWTDQESGYMESTSVEGDDRKLFRKKLNHPSGLVMLHHSVFWTSQHSSTIHWVDKNHPKVDFKKKISLGPLNYISEDSTDSIQYLEDLEGFENLRIVAVTGVYHYVHPCQESNGNCSHICVPLSYKTVSCLCPPGLSLLRPEYERCIVNIRCNANQFRCSTTNTCISAALKCNGIADCADAEDEIDCADGKDTKKCESFQFQCNDGSCIEKNLLCDSNYNCPDHSDEQDCSNQTVTKCEKSQFECEDGLCIDERSRCDNFTDCVDGSDEKLCDTVQCRPNMFQCQSGSCIPKDWECDRETDCIDGSDEHFSCSYKHDKCDPNEFACTNTYCIHLNLKCNQHNDCGDNSDEINCPKSLGTRINQKQKEMCGSHMFFCEESMNQSCLPAEVRCNGTVECYNGEDERNCNNCQYDEFMCKNRKCISNKWICDGTDDCGDKSDESEVVCTEKADITANMAFPLPERVPPCDDGYSCKNKQCVDIGLICNNKVDCSDGSDEGFSCSIPCSSIHCEQQCRRTPEGPKCFCKEGYKRAGNKINCMDIDECMIQPSVCSHKCYNFRGSFICSCYEGYVLRANKRSCKAIGHLKSIFYTSKNIIREIKFSPPSLKQFFSEWSPPITGMDILMSSNTLYYAFEMTGELYSQNLITNERNYIGYIGNPINIAIDWITQNIYFVDNQENNKTIQICRLGTAKCVAVIKLESNSQVTSLVVDPINKFIFYAITYWNVHSSTTTLRPYAPASSDCRSDGHCATSIIYKAKLDGSDITQLISKNVKQVSGLSVDYYKKRLYFCDLRKETLEVVDYNAKNRQVVIEIHPLLKSPIQLIIFEEYAYMLRLDSSRMIKCKIYESRECYDLDLFILFSKFFTIAQPSRQLLQKNVCENNTCSTVCVPATKGYTCLCNNGKDCSDWIVSSSTDIPNFTFSHNVLMALMGLCAFLTLSCFIYYIRWRHLRCVLYWITAPLTSCYIWIRTQLRRRNQPAFDSSIVEYRGHFNESDEVVFNLQETQEGQVVQGEIVEGDLIDLVNPN